MGGPVGKQKISLTTFAFLVSASLVISVLLGSGGPQRVEGTVFEEAKRYGQLGPHDEKDELPVWLSDYSTHVPLIGIPRALPVDLDPVEHVEASALVDSPWPRVQTRYEAAQLAGEAARKREHEREEAEYAAFIEDRMQRLSEVEGR